MDIKPPQKSLYANSRVFGSVLCFCWVHPRLKIILLSAIIAISTFLQLHAQAGNLQQLKVRLKQLGQNQQYLTDTAYANTLNQMAFVYALSYPDSAIALLAGQAARCRSVGFGEGEVNAYKITGNAYQTKGNFTTALQYFDTAYTLAKKLGYKTILPSILNNMGIVSMNQGNYTTALDKFYSALNIAEANHDKMLLGSILNNIAIIHFFQGKMQEAETDYKKMMAIAEEMADTVGIILAYNNIGEVNLEQKNNSQALQNLTVAYRLAAIINSPEMLVATTKNLGIVYARLDSIPKAINYFETAIKLSKQQGNMASSCKALIELAKVQNKNAMLRPALANGLEALQMATTMGQAQLLRDANETVSATYEALGQGEKALQHYQQFKIYSDSLKNIAGERAAANYQAEYEFSKKELVFQRQTLQQRWIIFSTLACLLSLALIVFIINRNRKRLNLANKLLQHTNEVINVEKLKVEETLGELKATQTRLIHAEKMASLGELTAGIAHEIQNPLNFVNNFSEVSNELIDEMKEALSKGNYGDADAIADDVQQNLQKINHHGKRADAIVKGMLQHSRGSSGATKEPTDINKLADEYARLAYQGLRAKDKQFNATLKTDFDESIGLVNIIPQDIGRVLLNLFTNAFYAVDEKRKSLCPPLGVAGYEPTVAVSTKKTNNKVEITITDNGSGIPKNIVNKIFQPFFTTKPTGLGTGLGLSLAYDIVKVHGGEISVESMEGQGTDFVVSLPCTA
jgi:signal transduction histidine kinase